MYRVDAVVIIQWVAREREMLEQLWKIGRNSVENVLLNVRTMFAEREMLSTPRWIYRIYIYMLGREVNQFMNIQSLNFFIEWNEEWNFFHRYWISKRILRYKIYEERKEKDVLSSKFVNLLDFLEMINTVKFHRDRVLFNVILDDKFLGTNSLLLDEANSIDLLWSV